MSAPRDSTATSVVPLASGAHYLVSVDRLRRGDSPRSGGEDHRHIARLVESETPWPPILVHRSTMRVIDGMHRLRAARIKGLAQIEVEFFDGDGAEAFVRGVELNIAHGLPLALSDRKAAAERIVDSMPQLSDRAIATYTGLSAKTIATIRRRSSVEIPQSNARIGADGRRRPTDAAHRRQRVLELLTTCPDMSLRKLAAAAEVSISTAHAVRKRLREQQPERRAESAAPTDPIAPLLQQLSRDPVMRLNQQGRDLLRWLHSHSIEREVWTGLTATVPPHLAKTVSELADRNAREWQALSGSLDIAKPE